MKTKCMNHDRADLSPAVIKTDQHFLLYAKIWSQF